MKSVCFVNSGRIAKLHYFFPKREILRQFPIFHFRKSSYRTAYFSFVKRFIADQGIEFVCAGYSVLNFNSIK